MTGEGGRCGALPLQARGFQAVLGCTDRVCPPGADSRQATGPLLTPALRPPTHGAEQTPAGQPGLPSLRGHCLGGAPGLAACASDARCPELILTLPPPGTCLILSLEPHLD